MKLDSSLIPILVGLWLGGASVSVAGERQSSPDDVRFFETRIRPLLVNHCFACHGPDKQKSGLRLDSAEALHRGGATGQVLIVTSQPEHSLLLKAVRHQGGVPKMPPKGKLKDQEIADLTRWVQLGGFFPGRGSPARTNSGPAAKHWAFQPPVDPPLPPVKDLQWSRSPLDRFILAGLEAKGLRPSPPADRRTLIRRVTFDLIGLPPSPDEVEAFLADASPDAFARVVDRLLASPRYGERWGKYWLDTAGYADSNGYFNADSDRPLAFRYRDYVIRSFNQDKPYDRFVTEQLAGDELAGYRPDGDVTDAMAELLTATHFLRNAPDGTGESDGNPDEVRTDRFTVLEGNLQIVVNSLMGLTIQCARCHEHKFEPIAHEEYYQLQAILYPAYCPERWTVPKDRIVSIASQARRSEHQRLTQRIDQQVKALQESLTTIAGPLREQLIEDRFPDLDAAGRATVLAAVHAPKGKRTPEQEALLKKHAKAIQVSDDDLGQRFPEYARVRNEVRQAIAAREKERPRPLETISIVAEKDSRPPVHHVLLRGQHNAPGKEVQPGVPAMLCGPTNPLQILPRPEGQISSGRRTALARWLTSSDHPLFARVMVNRIWQHHFGVGLVSTPDNLGQSGARPSHPELLDYLAVEFVRSGFRIKTLHRLILTSAVYRQSGTLREEPFAADPDNRLWWRFPLRRLDAEALRDALLAVSGELDPRIGGPYVPTRRAGDGSVEIDEKHEGARKRSIYLQQRRTQVTTLLELFDAPALVGNCSKRNTSTMPLQSLALLNSSFSRARAEAFAHRMEQETPDPEKRLALAFRLACGRPPSERERDASRRFQTAQQAVYGQDPAAARKVWTDFCQMILASNAFLYVE